MDDTIYRNIFSKNISRTKHMESLVPHNRPVGSRALMSATHVSKEEFGQKDPDYDDNYLVMLSRKRDYII